MIDPELKHEAGMILTLSRDGVPVLQLQYFAERQVQGPDDDDGGIEVVSSTGSGKRAARGPVAAARR